MSISGNTRLYGVLGDPIGQVRAPALLNPLLAGFDAVLVPIRVSAPDLAAVVEGLARAGNVDGLLVTVPHKAAICGVAAELGPMAGLVGAANALRRRPEGGWLADNFDGIGFVRGLRAAGHEPAGLQVGIVGAGGAGSAIAAAVLDAGAAETVVSDVDGARRGGLVDRLCSAWPGRARAGTASALREADLVINATPLGMRPGDPLPLDPERLAAGSVVADIIMSPPETALLRAAAARGLVVHHGRHMLDHQVSCYREFFGWQQEDSLVERVPDEIAGVPPAGEVRRAGHLR
ncbi:shikimate dehydrogenase family protein [Saccharopolyspora sp. NPDC002578]